MRNMMIKKIGKGLLLFIIGIVVIAGILLIYIIVEDQGYEEYQFKESKMETRKALILTWDASSVEDFWKTYEKEFFPFLDNLHQKGKIALVLPFEHKALKHPDKAGVWTNCVIILFDKNTDEELSNQIISTLQESELSSLFCTADLMRLQKGLDMFYPIKNGISKEKHLNQTIEYVFSQPEHREEYYAAQYLWSGPAMADLHSRDKAGRFIGFELDKRLFGSEIMPEWDVAHVFAFTTWQMIKSIPFFYGTWNKHAKRVFGEEMTFKKKLAEWDKIRLNVKGSAKQNMSLTLQQK